MPLGETGPTAPRIICRSALVRARLAGALHAHGHPLSLGRPGALCAGVAETGGTLGFITPLTHNFCETCNRVRVTCTGTLYMCLGQEDAADLRGPLRASEADHLLHAAIDAAIAAKPKGHDFVIERGGKPALAAHHGDDRRLEVGVCQLTAALIHLRTLSAPAVLYRRGCARLFKHAAYADLNLIGLE